MKTLVKFKIQTLIACCAVFLFPSTCSALGVSPATAVFNNVKTDMELSSTIVISRSDALLEESFFLVASGELAENLEFVEQISMTPEEYSKEVSISINTYGLTPGAYEGTIIVSSEVLAGYDLGIPSVIHLDVIEGDVLEYLISYPVLKSNEKTGELSFTAFAQNTGNQPLTIDSLELSITKLPDGTVESHRFELENAIEVNPFTESVFEIPSFYKLTKSGQHTASIKLFSGVTELFSQESILFHGPISNSKIYIIIALSLSFILSFYLLRKYESPH